MYKIFLCFLVALPSLAHSEQTMRIVSAGGSVTEIIYALDKQALIVATDSTSLYPAATATLPKLGYFRQLSVESILSFQPTHLIGAQATGPQNLSQQLEAAGVKVAILGERRDLHGLYEMITEIGQLLNAQDKAQGLINNISQDVTQLKIQAQKLSPVTALFVLSNSDRGLTVAGGNTIVQSLFNDAGIVNAAANMSDYKIMDNESILMANPDLIFVASHAIYTEQAQQALCQHPALQATKAGRKCAITKMESSSALGLSPRYPHALQIMLTNAALVQSHVD